MQLAKPELSKIDLGRGGNFTPGSKQHTGAIMSAIFHKRGSHGSSVDFSLSAFPVLYSTKDSDVSRGEKAANNKDSEKLKNLQQVCYECFFVTSTNLLCLSASNAAAESN